jgi:hypothetical protein
MRALCMLDKATDTHSEYVILMAFPRPQLFGEQASMLRLYVHCLPCFLILTQGRTPYNRKNISAASVHVNIFMKTEDGIKGGRLTRRVDLYSNKCGTRM